MMLANHTGIVFGRQLRPMARDPFTLLFGVLQPVVFLVLYGSAPRRQRLALRASRRGSGSCPASS